jgi:peptidoglycan hydrolase-like protein with peptidoglycan-binding domain
MRRVLTVVLTAGTALALAAGCSNDGSSGTNDAQGPGVPAPSASVSASPAPAPSVSATPTPSVSTPPARPPKLKVGSKGAAVVALQQRLTELGYWNGTADGKFGGTTQQAVYALQKAAGLGRDGSVGPKTRKALDAGVRPTARSKAGSGYLVEINLKKQLLMFVRNGEVVATLNTSTGSNMHYVYQGDTYLADTPSGHFKVGRQIDGVRHGPLGDLYRPKYFNGGIAVHGAPSIPPYPASHGCARVSNAAINWIWSTGKIPLKTKVWVYRG